MLVKTLQFKKGSLPFTYLGVPIFKGSLQRTYLQSIADKAIAKLACWKGKLLSFRRKTQKPKKWKENNKTRLY
ncbi:RNA-directed DNA polymerase (Reverse transcriptase) [Melia azedarach]|uniref:RNA-directed DNA polymerase (Reverse transcriptase) n=1 Tax=Melia azedarach TaxID=155640 RepID=A0ACC1YCC1_MELAZ|nr:RNA-directed DNA polymerase (Reverse transcriptase) [Melia azedarach]